MYLNVQIEPQKVELIPGYGVLLTPRQLDDGEAKSNGTPTRLIRNLISIFFSRDILARSSCYGSRNNNALDPDILSACISKCIMCIVTHYYYYIEYVQSKHSIACTALVDAVNDKCTNCRRKSQP